MFRVNIGLRNGYVISPWLFSLYMVGVMTIVNARLVGRRVGLAHNGHEWEINCCMQVINHCGLS